MKYNTFTLSNGLRIIHLPSTAPVVYCGYQINAGSRNEELPWSTAAIRSTPDLATKTPAKRVSRTSASTRLSRALSGDTLSKY